MRATHLPDDLGDWPADPFAVLGVRPGVDAKELRRAYTTLIRVFKPEHRPDHFRRIREAFELAQRFVPLFGPPSHAEPRRPADLESPREELSGPGLVTPERLWDQAVHGEFAAAYQGLRAELDRGPPRAELYARLYWLAAVSPELDPDRPAAEWLTRGLAGIAFAGTLLELYHGELLNNPAEAESPRSVRLTSADVRPDALAAVTRYRWQALARLARWTSIADEFGPVRERLRTADDSAWLSLVVELCTWIAFGRDDLAAGGLARMARAEVRSMEHLAFRQAAQFDQLDYVDAVGRSCKAFRGAGQRGRDLVAVLRDGWLLPIELLRRPLERLLADISLHPVDWVEFLDRVGPDAIGALGQFGNILNLYQSAAAIEAPSPHAPATVRKLAAAALADREQSPGWFRGLALWFCLDHAIDPGTVCSAYHPDAGGPDVLPSWVASLATDTSLHYVCWACRLFRA